MFFEYNLYMQRVCFPLVYKMYFRNLILTYTSWRCPTELVHCRLIQHGPLCWAQEHAYSAAHMFGHHDVRNNMNPWLAHYRIPKWETTSTMYGEHYRHPEQTYTRPMKNRMPVFHINVWSPGWCSKLRCLFFFSNNHQQWTMNHQQYCNGQINHVSHLWRAYPKH